MLHKRLDIADDNPQVFRGTTFARRLAMSARVPREDRDIFQTKRFHRFLPAGGMFVAAMEQQKRLLRRSVGKPSPIKKFRPVPTPEGLRFYLHKVKWLRLASGV